MTDTDAQDSARSACDATRTRWDVVERRVFHMRWVYWHGHSSLPRVEKRGLRFRFRTPLAVSMTKTASPEMQWHLSCEMSDGHVIQTCGVTLDEALVWLRERIAEWYSRTTPPPDVVTAESLWSLECESEEAVHCGAENSADTNILRNGDAP